MSFHSNIAALFTPPMISSPAKAPAPVPPLSSLLLEQQKVQQEVQQLIKKIDEVATETKELDIAFEQITHLQEALNSLLEKAPFIAAAASLKSSVEKKVEAMAQRLFPQEPPPPPSLSRAATFPPAPSVPTPPAPSRAVTSLPALVPPKPPQATRVLPPPPRTVLASPVGIGNAGANCWCNALLQGFFSVQSLREVYETVANFYAEFSAISREKRHGLALQLALNKYLRAKEALPDDISQGVRGALAHFGTEISKHATRHEDAHEGITILMGLYQDIVEGKSAALHPALYTTLQGKRIYQPVEGKAGAPRAPDPRRLLLPPSDGNAYTQLSADYSVALKDEPTYYLDLPLHTSTRSFPQLLKNCFLLGNNDPTLSVRLNAQKQEQTFKLVRTEYKFRSPPHEFLLVLGRFNGIGGKIQDRILDLTLILTLPAEATVEGRPILYDLDFFIVHSGEAKGGHYISYVLLGDTWFECNDDIVVTKTPQQILDILPISYIHHYRRRELPAPIVPTLPKVPPAPIMPTLPKAPPTVVTQPPPPPVEETLQSFLVKLKDPSVEDRPLKIAFYALPEPTKEDIYALVYQCHQKREDLKDLVEKSFYRDKSGKNIYGKITVQGTTDLRKLLTVPLLDTPGNREQLVSRKPPPQ